ncbi:unnamed protein product [Ilex paraguariensis]|uniref:Glutamate decarboxylase n=1 Tax=Ilex paraguariensis TaxID=185542 RepID=A0ABC8RVK6_9AQUA
MIAHLFDAPLGESETVVGVGTVGSSEAIMASLAFKRKWQNKRRAKGKPCDKPNIVTGANVQVRWEKFANYFEVELKEEKLREGYYVMDSVKAVELVDENTICVAAILGWTLNGEFEDVKLLNDLLLEKNKQTGYTRVLRITYSSVLGIFNFSIICNNLCISILFNSACGIPQFMVDSLHHFSIHSSKWDFRLPLVKSINVSGHKYGLVYAGIGWVIWRSKEDLPEELIFHINYLGADQPTFTLNFSKGSSQVIAQYYQLIRLGYEGHQNVMENCRDNALALKQGLEKTGRFNIVSKDNGVPVVAFSLKEKSRYNKFDVLDMLHSFQWIVSAYTMPPDAQHVTVLRVVVREDFSCTLAERLVDDITKVLHKLDIFPAKISANMMSDDQKVKNGTMVKRTALKTQREITDAWKKFFMHRKTKVIC